MKPVMNHTVETTCQENEVLDAFAAELTDAAYPIALKYGVSGSSLDMELEIWKTFIELVHRRCHELFSAPVAKQA
jgi:hypothetical protein